MPSERSIEIQEEIEEQASQLECLLPKLMRKLFTLDQNHPVADLPLAQLRVCMILQAGPKAMSTLSEELGISVSAVTQIADRLEKAGLVERISETDDRRMKKLQMTVQGAQSMKARRETRVRRANQALETLTPAARAMVLESVRILLNASIATAPEIPNEDPVGVRLEQ
jgi:DNA-binding MarR family transcriptional regulator